MKVTIRVISKIYTYLLHLYPSAFHKRFAEEMLLDFVDMLEAASKEGAFPLFLFILRELRDYPLGLLSAYLKEDYMSTLFRSEWMRSTLRGAFSLGLAFATAWTTCSLTFSMMENWGWIFLLQIANSHGWRLNYDTTAQTLLYFSGLILGALLAGVFLALCFRELHRISRYLLASLLGFTVPLAIVRLVGIFLKDGDSVFLNFILSQGSIVLIGLGFGMLFSLILPNRRKTPWLLLAGILGYYVARNLGIWLLEFAPVNSGGLFSWNELAFVGITFGLEGMFIGALLGAVSGWSGQKVISGEFI